jgi:prepilin-type processing-associated H-X9-DG protein
VTEAVETIWNRITADASYYQFMLEQKTKDVTSLAAALRSYWQAHGGILPEKIEDLVPTNLESMDIFSKELGVDVSYQPPWPKMLTGEPDRSKPALLVRRDESGLAIRFGAVAGPSPTYHPDLPLPDRLVKYEQDLASAWGDDLMPKLLVSIVYSVERLQFHISSDFEVTFRAHPAATPEGGLFVQEIREAKRGQCINQLKQLGLSMLMFRNEVPGGYTPAGFVTAYPDYIPDRRVLTCPNAFPHTISYKLVWPTANETEYVQLYRDLMPESAGRENPESYIPFIIETDECSDSMGRNVLFLDGHIEFREGELRDHPDIAPFLDLN